jgi:hypothetical protein
MSAYIVPDKSVSSNPAFFYHRRLKDLLFTATDKDRVEPTPKIYRPLFMQPIKDKIRFSSNISKGAYIKHRLLLYLSKQTFKKVL